MNGNHFLLRGSQGKWWFPHAALTPNQFRLVRHNDWHFRSQVGILQVRKLLLQLCFHALV